MGEDGFSQGKNGERLLLGEKAVHFKLKVRLARGSPGAVEQAFPDRAKSRKRVFLGRRIQRNRNNPTIYSL